MEDSIKWEKAMDDKMRSLEKNDTWVLTELPTGKRALLSSGCSESRLNQMAKEGSRLV